MTLKLVSFTICPFVQRAVLMLREKNQPFEVEYIDLSNKPEWFLKLSPRGKVPIVVTEDGSVLFESQAICEYLEEVYPQPRLAADDPVGRARDRAWFAFAGEDLFGPLWRLETAKTDEVLSDAKAKVLSSLERLETEMADRDWLSSDGSRFGMADVAVAPAFTRIASHLKRGIDLLDGLPNVAAWSGRVLARASMPQSVPDTWETDHDAYMAKNEAVAAR